MHRVELLQLTVRNFASLTINTHFNLKLLPELTPTHMIAKKIGSQIIITYIKTYDLSSFAECRILRVIVEKAIIHIINLQNIFHHTFNEYN